MEIRKLVKQIRNKKPEKIVNKAPQPVSKENFQKLYYNQGLNCTVPDWFYGKEVRVHLMPDVDKRVAQYITEGLEDFISQIGLDFRVKDFGNRSDLVKQLVLNADVFKALKTQKMQDAKKRIYHADVVAFNKFFPKNPIDWGYGYSDKGYIDLALLGERQKELKIIKNVTKHEASHLFLPYGYHHDKIRPLTNDYPEVKNCNNLYEAPTLELCEKCADRVKYFWKGIEEQTKMKFLKQ